MTKGPETISGVSPGAHHALQLIQYQQKRNTRCPSLVTRAVRRIVPLKNTFTVCPLPAEGGHVHFIPTLTCHTEGWLAGLSVQIQVSGFKKKTREKRCESSC